MESTDQNYCIVTEDKMVSKAQNYCTVTGEDAFDSIFNKQEKSWIDHFFDTSDLTNRYLLQGYSITLSIIIAYILFVKWIGPFYMRYRKPYNLRNVMIIYNFMNAAFSLGFACMGYLTISKYWYERCGFGRNIEYSPYIMKLRSAGGLWFLNKHFDLLDTVFFVLRKKNNQVSVLHVLHHAGVLFLGYDIIKYDRYSFYIIIGLFLNSLIHIVMYIYYGLAAFGPHMRKYLWWKQYMTQMQIVQFFIVQGYLCYSFSTGCDTLNLNEWILFIFISIILILFLNFYLKNYKQSRS